MSKIIEKSILKNFCHVTATSRFSEAGGPSCKSGDLLKSFSKSPLFDCPEEDMAKAGRIARSLEEGKGFIFVFAMGGMGAAGCAGGSPGLNKKVFHIDSLNEKTLCFLSSLKKDHLREAKWVFISKSGNTPESLFYLRWIEGLYLKKRLNLRRGQIRLLTAYPGSSLGVAVKGIKGSLVHLKTTLPGRFSFFTLSGFLQARLMGLDLQLFSKGFKKGCQPQRELESIILFFLSFLKRGKEGFLLVDSSFDSLARWFAISWSESLFKEKIIHPLRVFSFSDICHGYLEEVSAWKKGAFVLGLSRTSSLKGFEKWKRDREKALVTVLEKSGSSFLFFNFNGNRDFSLGYLIGFFFQIIYGMGKYTKTDIYSQPSVDNFKKLFHSENKETQTGAV